MLQIVDRLIGNTTHSATAPVRGIRRSLSSIAEFAEGSITSSRLHWRHNNTARVEAIIARLRSAA